MRDCAKIAHSSKSAAKTAARRVETLGRGSKVGRINVYRCPICNCWHIGHDRYRRTIRERAS